MTDQKRADKPARPDDSVMTIPADPEGSVYRFIIVAAKRARQLQSGQRPKIAAQSRKVTRLAVDEVRRGLIEYNEVVKTPPPEPEEEEPTDQ